MNNTFSHYTQTHNPFNHIVSTVDKISFLLGTDRDRFDSTNCFHFQTELKRFIYRFAHVFFLQSTSIVYCTSNGLVVMKFWLSCVTLSLSITVWFREIFCQWRNGAVNRSKHMFANLFRDFLLKLVQTVHFIFCVEKLNIANRMSNLRVILIYLSLKVRKYSHTHVGMIVRTKCFWFSNTHKHKQKIQGKRNKEKERERLIGKQKYSLVFFVSISGQFSWHTDGDTYTFCVWWRSTHLFFVVNIFDPSRMFVSRIVVVQCIGVVDCKHLLISFAELNTDRKTLWGSLKMLRIHLHKKHQKISWQ